MRHHGTAPCTWIPVVALAMNAIASGEPASDFTDPKARYDKFQAAIRSELDAAEARRARIAAELKQLGPHEWAGVYSYGPVALWLAPVAGMVNETHGCMGVYDLNHGEISAVRHDFLELKLAIPEDLSYSKAMSSRLYRVRWGGRHYLIPQARMVEFCNAVNAGTGERLGTSFFFLRGQERRLPVAGLPDVPAEYRGYLLERPVVATIVEVDRAVVDGCRAHTFAEVSAGAADGIRVGMRFHVTQPADIYAGAEVLAVERNTCRVQFVEHLSAGEDGVRPAVGWVLSTRQWTAEMKSKAPEPAPAPDRPPGPPGADR